MQSSHSRVPHNLQRVDFWLQHWKQFLQWKHSPPTKRRGQFLVAHAAFATKAASTEQSDTTMAIACEPHQQNSLELQDVTMNMNTDVECTKATNLELKVMLVLFDASDEWQ